MKTISLSLIDGDDLIVLYVYSPAYEEDPALFQCLLEAAHQNNFYSLKRNCGQTIWLDCAFFGIGNEILLLNTHYSVIMMHLVCISSPRQDLTLKGKRTYMIHLNIGDASKYLSPCILILATQF